MSNWQSAGPGSFAVIGDPIDQSLSPTMHNLMYAAEGYPYIYRKFRVPIEEFGAAVSHLSAVGYRGLNVTVPLKSVAMDWCKRNGTVETEAPTLNALDLLKKRGTNTDVPGFLTTLAEFTAGKEVLLLGAGGTAMALVPSLVKAGYRLTLWNRSPEKLKPLVDSVRGAARVVSVARAEGFDVVVNTTSAGLQSESPPVDWSESSAFAYDIAYSKDGLTPFLTLAQQAGRPVKDGRAMLVEQGALSFEWWTGQNAFRDVMTEALKCR